MTSYLIHIQEVRLSLLKPIYGHCLTNEQYIWGCYATETVLYSAIKIFGVSAKKFVSVFTDKIKHTSYTLCRLQRWQTGKTWYGMYTSVQPPEDPYTWIFWAVLELP